MLKWIKDLDPVVQAAIIGACATVLGVIIKGVFDVVTNKKKKDNTTIPNINTKQNNSGNNNVNFGAQNQDGSGNVQNTYINCNIQPSESSHNDNVDDRIEKYMQEHTATKEDIDKLFDVDLTPDNETTEEKSVTTIDNAVIVRMKNLAGGNTVLIGDEKTITEQIIKEHDEEIERALNEI